MNRKIILILFISVPIMIFFSAIMASTSANIVAESGVEFQTQEITADQLKPPECYGLSLSSFFVGVDGSTSNDLILGSSGSDTLNGNDGNDCLVGGSGDDVLDGGDGTDVCIGGTGNNTFLNCETQIVP